MKTKGESALDRGRTKPKIGPSDSSDTYSDRPDETGTDSDAGATGERGTAGRDPRAETSVEYDTDRIVSGGEAGLGNGLDEAEEARRRPVKPTKGRAGRS